MFEKSKEQKEEDMPVSQEELAALGIKISMNRGELDRHMAMLDRKKALGEKLQEKGTPTLTDEDKKLMEAALARNQEVGK